MSLQSALTARFDDHSEIRDVAYYGCAGGVSGFIYYRETTAFYDEHESEILDFLNDCDMSIKNFCTDDDDMTTLKNKMVWATVEMWCQAREMELETAAVA
jgi:hypothetical protein